MSKGEARQQALRSRRTLSKEEVSANSASVARRLMLTPEFAGARTVATYVAKSDEVQTMAIIQSSLEGGKRVLVPRSEPSTSTLVFAEIHSPSELSPGHFGILEPAAGSPGAKLGDADVALVPVVAWDEEGNRIGYGKGYFDRALAAADLPFTMGLAFEIQRAPRLPSSPTDIPLDMVVTERRVLRFGRARK